MAESNGGLHWGQALIIGLMAGVLYLSFALVLEHEGRLQRLERAAVEAPAK